MTVFAVEYTYDAATAAVRDDHRSSHREWLGRLHDEGTVLVTGPYPDGSGALLVFAAPDEASLRSTLAEDPFLSAGAIAGTRVTEWNPVIGPFQGN